MFCLRRVVIRFIKNNELRKTNIIYFSSNSFLNKLDLHKCSVNNLIPGSSLTPGLNVPKNIQMSTTAEIPEDKHLSYDQLIDLKKQGNMVLIDVREPQEIIEVGTLPDSHNIPLGEVEDAFNKSPEEFEKTYGFEKPTVHTDIVFSCRSGKRSLTALRTALGLGYNHAKHYAGGWLDWNKQRTQLF